MKKLLITLSIAIFTLTSYTQGTAKSKNTEVVQTKPVVELINPTDLNSKLGDIQLIDVRTPKEYNLGHIKGAKNINFFDENFVAQMSKLDKDKHLYIYCRSGKRSGKSAKKLETAGFTKIYDLQGGFKNWSGSNLEIVK
ncbi:MAG: rhodanese-like domain-containing protein [Flavobacteriaceae bacterium]|nr:rhodanese-like domain-containing protein [Flavobacteriaceae bacterium]